MLVHLVLIWNYRETPLIMKIHNVMIVLLIDIFPAENYSKNNPYIKTK